MGSVNHIHFAVEYLLFIAVICEIEMGDKLMDFIRSYNWGKVDTTRIHELHFVAMSKRSQCKKQNAIDNHLICLV